MTAFKFIGTGCLLGLAAMPAGAQVSVADSARMGLQRMTEVVVTGQYGARAADSAVQKITVIDRKQIDAMAAQTLRDVLTNENGVRLTQDNILGSSMSLQGISGQNIKYLMDGVPVIGRQNGDIDLSQFNLDNVERIEIVRGPMSVSYGNNALGGTINLITRRPGKTRYEGGVTAYYETIGTYNFSGRFGVHQGNHQLTLSGGRNFFDGWQDGEKVSFSQAAQPADERRYQQWKPKEQYFANVHYAWQYGLTTWSYQGRLFEEEIVNRGMPRKPYGESALDDHYKTLRADNAIFVNSRAIPHHLLSVQAAYNYYKRVKNTFARDLTNLGSELSGNDGDQDTSAFHLWHGRATLGSLHPDRKLNYEVGLDVNVESARGARIEAQEKKIGDYAVFASAEYQPFQTLTLRPGLRYAYNTQYAAPLTPALHVRYAPGTRWNIRAAYAKGFRAPDLKELYFYFVDINHNIRGNKDLKAEQSDNFSLNVDYGNRLGKLRYKVEALGFYNNIRNLISLAVISGTEYSYINIGRYKTHGGGLSLAATYQRLSTTAGFTYTGYYNELHETDATVTTYSYAPELRGSLGYVFGATGFSLNVFYKYTGEMPGYAIIDNAVAQTSIAAYQMADASVQKTFAQGRYTIAAGVKNIFDVQQITATAQAEAHSASSGTTALSTGRNFFLKLNLNLRSKS